MQGVERPGGDPNQNVRLTLQGIDICKKHRDQQSGREQAEGDGTFNVQGTWASDPVRESTRNRLENAAAVSNIENEGQSRGKGPLA